MRGNQFVQLTAFVAVAESCSFTKAAVQLGIGTTRLSQDIRSLEERFGVRLLNRTTRSVSPTDAGEHLLRHLKPILENIEEAEDVVNKFRDTPAGRLRLSVHPLVAKTTVGATLRRFSAEFPNINLEIWVDAECNDIVSERFDAGIHLSDVIAQDMIAIPVGRPLEFSTVASPDYLARNGVPSLPADLSYHNCIKYCWNRDARAEPWTFSKTDEKIDVAIAGSPVVNDPIVALQAGLDGLGIVQLPKVWIEPLVTEGRLVKLVQEWSPNFADFRLFFSSRRHVPFKLRVLVDFLRKATKEAVACADSGRQSVVISKTV
jgi:DNA-binding transcriptional LysR family regulator